MDWVFWLVALGALATIGYIWRAELAYAWSRIRAGEKIDGEGKETDK